MKLCLDSQLEGVNDYTGGIQANGAPIVIGGVLKWNHRNTNDLSKLYIRKPFNGYIDDVAIYGGALDSKQISPTHYPGTTRGCRGLAEPGLRSEPLKA